MANGAPAFLSGTTQTSDPALMTSDSPGVAVVTASQAYGIFLSGTSTQALTPDSFVSYEYQNDSRLSQYPQEGGAFSTYNKVATPFDVRVTLNKGGSAADRSVFLADVETAAKALTLYSVVTPERTYLSTNIVKIAHRHSQRQGATLLTVEIWFLEVRVTAQAQFSSSVPAVTAARSPTGNDPVNSGIVQAQPVTQAQQAAVMAALKKAVPPSPAAGAPF